MTLRGQADVKFTITAASGGASATRTNLSNYIDTMAEVGAEAKVVEVDGFGESFIRHFYSGAKIQPELEIEGWYDDGSSTPHSLFGNSSHIGTERFYEVDFGASDVVNGRLIVKSYVRMPKRGEITRWKAVLLPSGAYGTNTATA
jgi:hypothetical protein